MNPTADNDVHSLKVQWNWICGDPFKAALYRFNNNDYPYLRCTQ